MKKGKSPSKGFAKRDLEFLYEIGTLRYVARTWKRFLNPDFENLAEHHFRIVWIALLIAQYERNVNTEKLMKMALAHDIVESRVGDVDYLSRQYVIRNDKLGIADMLGGTAIEKEFLALFAEYEERKSIESKILKDADNLTIDFEIREQEFKGLRFSDNWKEIRTRVAKEFLFTQTAKNLWKSLQKSNPHDWHKNSRNRFTSGDWKKKTP